MTSFICSLLSSSPLLLPSYPALQPPSQLPAAACRSLPFPSLGISPGANADAEREPEYLALVVKSEGSAKLAGGMSEVLAAWRAAFRMAVSSVQ